MLGIAAFIFMFAACRSNQQSAMSENTKNPLVIGFQTPTPSPDRPTGMHTYVPRAVVYKTNGDYNFNVPIQVTPDGTTVISFPAPSDLSTDAMPLPLANGFLLDRRGVSSDTRFTSYTYSQYAAMQQPPTTDELLKAIIPNATITELVQLPMSASEAVADTTEVNKLIRTGFPGCNILIQAPAER